MIKNLLRAATAAALAILPVTVSSPAHAAETLPLSVAVHQLDLADESREGYTRDKFRHWNAGQNPSDGCNTRNEVLIAEAVEPPAIGPGCKLTGGTWWSYYDATTVSGPAGLDIDHMVPLAESWDSGASAWTAQRREAYANDLEAPTSLVGVTARSNRSKSDQDPGTWVPPSGEVHCQYAAEWTATKLRWNLTIDPQEQAELLDLAEQCPTTEVHFEPAP